jgi:hypothetical protein
VTVFHDRRAATYRELTGNRGDYMLVAVPGQLNAAAQERNDYLNDMGYSGGDVPSRNAAKYPLDQTTSVVNMR